MILVGTFPCNSPLWEDWCILCVAESIWDVCDIYQRPAKYAEVSRSAGTSGGNSLFTGLKGLWKTIVSCYVSVAIIRE